MCVFFAHHALPPFMCIFRDFDSDKCKKQRVLERSSHEYLQLYPGGRIGTKDEERP